MEFYIDLPKSFVEQCVTAFTIIIVIILAYRIYKKQRENIKLWKISLVIFIGMTPFNFQYEIYMFGFSEMIKFAVLPLGVWLLYFLWRNHRVKWQRYRKYAWLGFWSNYIVLMSVILTTLIQSLIYPIDRPGTYLANINEAELVIIHPSALKSTLIDKKKLDEQLEYMNKMQVDSDQWYLETHNMKLLENEVVEKFPYLLTGVEGKWGNGYNSLIYIEHDGKGILITNGNHQYYYRFEQSVLTEVRSDYVT